MTSEGQRPAATTPARPTGPSQPRPAGPQAPARPPVAAPREPTGAGVPRREPTGAAALQARPAPPQRGPTRSTTTGAIIEGRYRLEQVLGSGGMSTVFRATHVRTGGKLAVKILDPRLSGKADMQQRTLQEARAMMDIQSNHVVRAYDVGTTNSGQIYLVMEYLEGEDLDRTLQREGPLPWPRVAAMAVQICSGLAAAHAKGTIHRDIKPQNCFRVTIDRNPDHIKLVDFGIAKDTNTKSELTQDGVLLGTPEYMAPELIATTTTPDARTDIYALGATLYKLLTGAAPFAGKNALDILYHQKHTSPAPPSSKVPERELPAIADELLLKALAKDPSDRFQSADEMAHAFLTAFDVPTTPITRHMSQPNLIAISERSRPGTTPLGTPRPDRTPVGTPRPDRTPVGTPAPTESGGHNEPSIRGQNPPSQEYATSELRAVTGRDLAVRGGTLLSLALVFGVASWFAAPSAPPPGAADDDEVAALAPAEPTPEPTPPPQPETPVPQDSPPPQPEQPVPQDAPPPQPEQPVPTDTPPAQPEQPVPQDTPPPQPEQPVPTDTPPPQPERPAPEDTPPDAGQAADAAPTAPEPGFAYRSAEKELRSQHKFLQNCLDGANQGNKTLKFSIEVRKSGMPRHKISVFSGNGQVRSCVRDLFAQFPFDPSPRGGAFTYTYGAGKGSLTPIPMSAPTTTK